MSVKKEEIDDVRDDLMFVIKTLIRLCKMPSSATLRFASVLTHSDLGDIEEKHK